MIRFGQHSSSTLQQLAMHLSSSFSQVVKEAHRVLQLKSGERSDYKKVK